MIFAPNSFENEREIYVRVINFFRETGILIVDFVDSLEAEKFNLLFEDFDIFISGPSMILVNNYYQKVVTEGVVYGISTQSFIESAEEVGFEIITDSYVLRFSLTLKNNAPPLIGNSKSFSFEEGFFRRFDFPGIQDEGILHTQFGDEISLIVRDVGQGNWNEIYSDGKCRIVYDIGCPIFAKRTEVDDLIKGRKEILNTDNPGLIISHWDLDHYHCLCTTDEAILKSFKYIIAPSYAPSLTSRIILSKLVNQYPSKFIATSFPKPEEKKPYNPMIKKEYGEIQLFIGCDHHDRNRSGIILNVNLRNKGAILTGDHHYSQITNCVLPYIDSISHCIVVPHHGGKAGSFIYERRSYQKLEEAIISVGKNHYGHPKEEYVDALRKQGFKVVQTRFKKHDIQIELLR